MHLTRLFPLACSATVLIWSTLTCIGIYTQSRLGTFRPISNQTCLQANPMKSSLQLMLPLPSRVKLVTKLDIKERGYGYMEMFYEGCLFVSLITRELQ